MQLPLFPKCKLTNNFINMKRTLLKAFLVATGLVAGLNVALAEAGSVTTNVDIDFSNSIVGNEVQGNVGAMAITQNSTTPTEINKDGRLVLGNGDHSVELQADQYAKNKDIVTVSFDLAFGKLVNKDVHFYLKDAEGNNIVSFSYNCYNDILESNLGLLSSNFYHGYNTVIWDRHTNFTIAIDYAKQVISTHTTCTHGDEGNYEVQLTNINPVASFVIGSSYNNSDRRCEFDNLKITTTEGDYSSVTAQYDVNFVCNGELIRKDIREGDVGSEINLLATDMEPFFSDDGTKKYFYESDDCEGKTVSEDATTVVVVTVREAATWNYSLKAVDGDGRTLLEDMSTGSAFEQEEVDVPYRKYINVGGTLSEAGRGSAGWYLHTLTLSQENQEESITYSASEISNVVYFSEAEDIEGMTAVSSGNANIRCSNAMGAYNEGETVMVTTLLPGVYKLTACLWGNASEDVIQINVGETVWNLSTIGSITEVTYNDGNSFTVTEPTAITIPACGNGGNSPRCLDYIYIQKVSDIKNIPASGYASFSSPSNVAVPEGVAVYKAAVMNNEYVVLTEVETDVIPANTGVLIYSEEEGDKTFNVVSGEASGDFSGNQLIATSMAENATVPTDGTYYALMANEAKFAVVKGGTALSANKAYIKASADAAKTMRLIIGGETTGIDEVEAATVAGDGHYYNLQGVRVEKPAAGIYIHNGKKVIVK